jgi:hypothetical protein
MTTQSAFTPEEWRLLHKTLHEPGVAVIVAAPGGVLREIWAVIGGLLDASDEFAGSELVLALLDSMGTQDGAIPASEAEVPDSWKPAGEGFMDGMIQNLRQAARAVQTKATPQEFEDYKRLVLWMAERVAAADKERGSDQPITPDEQRVLDEIKAALNRKV